jgi:hypothetical protein
MKHFLPLVLLSAFLAAVPASIAERPELGAEAVHAMALLEVLEGVDECGYTCSYWCAVQGDHKLDEGGAAFTAGLGSAHFCVPFEAGCTAHLCDGGLDEEEEEEHEELEAKDLLTLEQLLESASSHEISMMLAQSPRLEYNRGRDALQVIGCDDGVVLSVPQNGRLRAVVD